MFAAVDRRRAQKEAALAAAREPGFWESPGRFEALASIEYLDRLDAAGRTAEGLLRRLPARGSGTAPAARLVSLLAERLYLLRAAGAGLDAGDPHDAVVQIETAGGRAARGFAQRLREMYAAWAARRGMRLDEVSVRDGGAVVSVSGLAAYTILRLESGLHVLERPARDRSFERSSVRVTVTPDQSDPADQTPSRKVVRRYREQPSPLVRDAVRGWRTGRLDRVLGGDFDLIS